MYITRSKSGIGSPGHRPLSPPSFINLGYSFEKLLIEQGFTPSVSMTLNADLMTSKSIQDMFCPWAMSPQSFTNLALLLHKLLIEQGFISKCHHDL